MGPAGFEPATKGLWVPCSNRWAKSPEVTYYNVQRRIFFKFFVRMIRLLKEIVSASGRVTENGDIYEVFGFLKAALRKEAEKRLHSLTKPSLHWGI